MKAYLHIGMPKTGTTSIQDWLTLNSDRFLEQNLFVVPFMSAHRLAVEVIDPAFAARCDVQDIRAQVSLEQALKDAQHDRSIISSEYFALADPTQTKRLFVDANINIARVIAYLRRQDILSASGYAQDVKALGVTYTIDVAEYTPVLDWFLLREKWAAISDEVTLLNYDRAAKNLMASFACCIDLVNCQARPLNNHHNVSLSAEMTEVARLLNIRNESEKIQYLRPWMGRCPSVKFGFSSRITQEFEHIYLDGNKKLADFYPGEFDSYAATHWTSTGKDFSGLINENDLEKILALLNQEA